MANGSPALRSRKKIVSIGGGNGPYMVGDGLREKDVDVTILTTPADSGGDSGDIRNEMGEILPPGDLRRGMMALMDPRYSSQLRRWFDHRLDVRSSEFRRRNTGNGVISSAIDAFGNIEGLKFVEWLCHVKGTVLPMSTDDVHLHGKLDDGTLLNSEAEIDQRPLHDERLLVDVWLEPAAYICSEAAQAILEADLITFGPGDLDTSIAPNQKVKGVKEVLAESKAIKVAIPSLMTKWSETRGYHVHDFVGKMVEFGIGSDRFDYTLVNKTPLNTPELKDLLEKYKKEEKSEPISIDGDGDNLELSRYTKMKHQVDLLSQSGLRQGLIRHDARKVARALMDILYAPDHPLRLKSESSDFDAPVEDGTSNLLHRMEEAEAKGSPRI